MDNYQHFVFDIDGTLLNTKEADLKSLQETIEIFSNKLFDLDQLLYALNLSSKDALKHLQIKNIEQGINLWKEKRQKYIHTIQIFDGINLLIKQLKNRGFHLGIITSKNKKEYEHDFSKLSISSFFEIIICLEDTFHPKPHPNPLIAYIQRSKINKKEILYIGDSINDSICAQRAQIDFALALWGNPVKHGIKAKYYFRHPTEILTSFKKRY